MNLIDTLRINFGLYWRHPAPMIIAAWVAVIVFWIVVSIGIVNLSRLAISIYETSQKAEEYKKQAMRNEEALITCLNAGVIGRDERGETTACGNPLHFTLLKVKS